MTTAAGKLYLIPVSLGEAPLALTTPAEVGVQARSLDYFVVENAKTARAELKRFEHPRPLRDLDIRELPENPGPADLDALLAPIKNGLDCGLMSEAGCPAVADPGALLVRRAHEAGIQVVPMVGPSSLLLGLMASGLNGQSFAFHGYLPVGEGERDTALRALEDESRRLGRAQIFIETPYRNERMLDALLKLLKPDTRLCIACDLNTAAETLLTRSVRDWRKTERPALAKRPALFLLLA